MSNELLEMSVNLVTAHLTQNRMQASDVPAFIREIHATLQSIASGAFPAVQPEATTNTTASDAFHLAPKPAQSEPSAPVPSEASEPEQSGGAPTPSAQAAAEVVIQPGAELLQQIPSHRIAFVRNNNLGEKSFEGLDPWLAARLPAKIAAKLNRESNIHPSVYPDKLICLEDGSEVTLLRAYVKKRFDLTEAQYAEKWNLPDDYPMAPPEYIRRKRELAIASGLGNTVRAKREKTRSKPLVVKTAKIAETKAAAPILPTEEKVVKRGRKPATTPKAKRAVSRRTLSLFPKDGQSD